MRILGTSNSFTEGIDTALLAGCSQYTVDVRVRVREDILRDDQVRWEVREEGTEEHTGEATQAWKSCSQLALGSGVH